MAIYSFENIRYMIELLKRHYLVVKNINRKMINTILTHTRNKTLKYDSANTNIDPKYFNTSFFTVNTYTTDNYSKNKYFCILLLFF